MGEVGVSSEGGGAVELEAAEGGREAERKEDESGGSPAVLRWERFLAKMAVRVLLVEADDSTRQIINALLRKCGYKVAAVSDGLKAWELLKKNPHTVDLVLAEVDLPSISGYALLTLIMEHEICKNIPVIMMSSHDSVSTVYGCMLRGAADFLVKPIRKNELTNLWQHVWRRQASSSGIVRDVDESVAQQKVEAMAENNAISNGECREKGSEAQSSCSKPDIDTERENTEHIQDLLQPNWDKSLPGVDQASDEDPAQIKSCKQGIDLIGAFDDYLKCNYISSSSNTSPNKFDSAPALDLSLTRSYPSSMLNQFADKHRLNHSDGSAFTPYVNKGVQNRGLTLPIPVRAVRFDGLSNGYSPVISPTDSPGSGHQDSPLEPNPVHPFNHHAITSMQLTGLADQNGELATTQTEKNQSEPIDECRHFSSATDQSGNSSLCSGRTQVPIAISTAECRKEEVSLVQDGNSQRSSQREAALIKFRLKRKDRCYEKKVRYESRKKLAEQRPRVKGQFVRRQPTGPPAGDNELITTANQ